METNKEQTRDHPRNKNSVLSIIGKAILIFLALNLVFAFWFPIPALGRVSAYNLLFPGRKRLPYSDNPQKAYNLSLYNLEAMFASHEIAAGDKPADEYRVIVIGDSATWGFLLPPEHTVSAYLDVARIKLPDGRHVRVYNLGYPVMSLTKDLLILSHSLRYDPDLIIWPLTMESFPYDKQLFPPLLQNNPGPVRSLIEIYHLNLDPLDENLKDRSLVERTIYGARRSLADLIRLQLYGVMWAATGIDQDIPDTFTARMEDLPAEEEFHDFQPPHLNEGDLAFDVLAAGVSMAGDIPVLFLNEPMFISQGENSDIRYNYYYPRWAYDDFRRMMLEQSRENEWHYLDMWDFINSSEFTNSAIHITPLGTQQFAQEISETIEQFANQDK
ncbi:hypothetical protein ACFLV7_06785 [Chloroflexota bacterium]